MSTVFILIVVHAIVVSNVLIAPDPCSSENNQCQNGASCVVDGQSSAGYFCTCTEGYTGTNCDQPAGSGCTATQDVYCVTCSETDSLEDCDTKGTPTVCTGADAVCEVTVTYDEFGGMRKVSRQCQAHAACPDLSLAPCPTTQQPSSTCTKCQAGNCFEKDPCTFANDGSLHCYTCHGRSQDSCWVSGLYEPCKEGSMCFLNVTTNVEGRTSYNRGCVDRLECFKNSPTLTCMYDSQSQPGAKDVSKCGAPPTGKCYCRGDPHCMGFDGKKFDLKATCFTTFARDGCTDGLPSSSPSFSITINPDHLTNEKVAVQEVVIKFENDGLSTEIEIGQITGEVVVDGQTQNVMNLAQPLSANGAEISLEDEDIVAISLPNGVRLESNFYREISVEMPLRLRTSVCGICGNFDGDSANDYSLGPNDKAAICPKQAATTEVPGSILDDTHENLQKYAISWLESLDEDEPRCLDDCDVD